MQGWQLALLVIAAIFVGMWIPVSLQLFATLRSGQRFFEIMGESGKKTLDEVSTSIVALNQTIADVGEVAHAAAQIKDSIRLMSSIGAAVVPAVIALVRALREPTVGQRNETDNPATNTASDETEHTTPTKKESTP